MLALFDTNPRFRYVTLIVLSLAAAVSIIFNINRGMNDQMAGFDMQWDVARMILMRENPYTAYLTQTPTPFEELVGHTILPRQVPSVIAFLFPYALFDWPVARLLWILSNLAFSAGWVAALLLLYEGRIRPARFLLWFALLTVSMYWGAVIWVGQHTVFSLCFFTLSLVCLQRKRVVWAGVCVALSLFKYHLIVPMLLIYLYKRAYRPLFIAAVMHAIVTVAVAAWLGENPVQMVLNTLNTSNSLLDEGHYHIFALVLRGAQRFGLGENLLLPSIAAGILITATFLVTLYAARKPSAEREIKLLILLILVALVWVYHRSYDWVAYFFFLYYALNGLLPGKWFPRWLLFISIMELYLPLIIPLENVFLNQLAYWPRAAFHYATILYLFVDLIRPWGAVRVATQPLATPELTSS